jgi:hypothetical protein
LYYRVLDAAMEMNYAYVLLGVAILWRPQPNAKDYAFVMELPALTAGDDEDAEGVLEMTDVVPSALDSDDDEEEISFEDEPAVARI